MRGLSSHEEMTVSGDGRWMMEMKVGLAKNCEARFCLLKAGGRRLCPIVDCAG